jgi:uncharacterized membrane protein
MEQSNSKSWRATLTPHRSLNRQGFNLLISAISLVSFGVGLFFYHIGAWPVVGFMGLDVALIWLAFNRNFADARRAECIEITNHEVVLQQLSERRAPREYRFVRRWVRVELEEDKERELVGPLYLRFQDRRTEIASFLGAEERQAFAKELQAALVNPRF